MLTRFALIEVSPNPPFAHRARSAFEQFQEGRKERKPVRLCLLWLLRRNVLGALPTWCLKTSVCLPSAPSDATLLYYYVCVCHLHSPTSRNPAKPPPSLPSRCRPTGGRSCRSSSGRRSRSVEARKIGLFFSALQYLLRGRRKMELDQVQALKKNDNAMGSTSATNHNVKVIKLLF